MVVFSSWPIRTLSFSCDGAWLASASEDLCIEISDVLSGDSVHRLPTTAAMNTLAWHPSRFILAYAGDEVDKAGKLEGNLRLFGLSV